ncbi:uncharacterized protein EV420DRAFT_1564497 [Desarmillaria tabescens]|uniref:Uncharacterized protein n=1 Tax=Armillaria tabescens TaxID=1929756 RepID=A0AA39JXA2_ARMTA|nr:uncharacterized protein EV420DRAFT_1564497 [Desarmillaria tabescens]KAK0449535.1 hypothetical protein EV420DRAFT_1564497 [Desarmillaria tabescens]
MSVFIAVTSFTITNAGTVDGVISDPGGAITQLPVHASASFAIPGPYTINLNNVIGATMNFNDGNLNINKAAGTVPGAEFTVAVTVA